MAAPRVSRPVLTALAATTSAVLLGALVPGPASADPRPSIASVTARIDDLNHQAEQAAERYNDARVQLDAVAKDLARVKARLAAQQAKVSQAQTVLGEFAAATYRSGGLDPAVQLLLSQNPETFLRRASSLDEISRQQAQVLTDMTVARQRLAQDQLAAAQQVAKQQRLERELQAEKSQVEAKLREAQQVLDGLQADERARLERAREAARQQALAQARQAAARERAAAAARVSRSQTRTSVSRTVRPASSTPSSGRAAAAVAFAYAQLGEPYVWGGAGPNSWDCSGLTTMAWRAGGVSLPHSAAAQSYSGRRIPRSQLQPGDLVFFYSPISHVGIYIGGGRMIDAPHPGATVRITTVSSMPFAAAVRF